MASDLRMLLLGDVHGALDALQVILASAKASGDHYDVIVCPGDLGCEVLTPRIEAPGERRALYEVSMRAVFESCRVLNLPFVYVPGNHDLPLPNEDDGAINVDLLQDRPSFRCRGWEFWGIGGSPHTPVGFPYEWDDERLGTELRRRKPPSGNRSVLVSHCPPFGTSCDVSHRGEHFGSHSVRRAIEECTPTAVVCGHVHEAASCEVVDGSFVINAGAIEDVRGLVMQGPRQPNHVPLNTYSYFAVLLSDAGITAILYMVSRPDPRRGPVAPPLPIRVEPIVWHSRDGRVQVLKRGRSLGARAWDV